MVVKLFFEAPQLFFTFIGERVAHVLEYQFATIAYHIVERDVEQVGQQVENPHGQQRMQLEPKVQRRVNDIL